MSRGAVAVLCRIDEPNGQMKQHAHHYENRCSVPHVWILH
jgi:hypothetical protein